MISSLSKHALFALKTTFSGSLHGMFKDHHIISLKKLNKNHKTPKTCIFSSHSLEVRNLEQLL